MDRYYEQINELVLGLLVPARTQKVIDREIFQKFCDILEEIETEVKGEASIQRKIAGLLFFIYRSLSNEVTTNDYKDELFRAVGKLEEILDKILWDSPFKE